MTVILTEFQETEIEKERARVLYNLLKIFLPA